MTEEEYQCGMCHQVYKRGWSEEEAWEETQQYWPGVAEEECEVVCDDCWQQIHPQTHPDEYAASLLKLSKESTLARSSDRYKVYFHTDESANAYIDGEYTWEQALERKEELLKHYPSVTLGGIRFWGREEQGEPDAM